MNKGEFLYSLCGWRLRSDIRLPELRDWSDGDATEAVEVVIGSVPETLGETAFRTGWVEIGEDGRQVRMQVDDVATYLIEDGVRITVDPAPGMDPGSADVRLFLLGGVLGYLCHQRGVLPLHASAVEIDGRAVLFTGISGAGKSTLANAFVQRGHRMLSDDVAPVALTAGGVAILPSIARIRLWPDSAEQAGWPADALERCRSSLLKLARPVEATVMAGALPPGAVVHLQAGHERVPCVTAITGIRAVTALETRVYRHRGLTAIAGRTAGTQRIATAAARIPHHFRMERRVDYASLPATVDVVMAALRSAQ